MRTLEPKCYYFVALVFKGARDEMCAKIDFLMHVLNPKCYILWIMVFRYLIGERCGEVEFLMQISSLIAFFFVGLGFRKAQEVKCVLTLKFGCELSNPSAMFCGVWFF